MNTIDKVVFEPAYKDVALAGVYEISKILTGTHAGSHTWGGHRGSRVIHADAARLHSRA